MGTGKNVWKLTILDRVGRYAVTSAYQSKSARELLEYYRKFIKPYHSAEDVLFIKHDGMGNQIGVYSIRQFLLDGNFSTKRKRK